MCVHIFMFNRTQTDKQTDIHTNMNTCFCSHSVHAKAMCALVSYFCFRSTFAHTRAEQNQNKRHQQQSDFAAVCRTVDAGSYARNPTKANQNQSG